MKKQFWQIAILMLFMIALLSACGSDAKREMVKTTETTELELEPDPEWLSENAIDEAYACLFPLEGEKNVELAQEILLPLVEVGNAEAQYYWGYIYDFEIVDNNGECERESLYWYRKAAKQGFTKAYLGVGLNEYSDSDERTEMLALAESSGLFEMEPEKLNADGCNMIGCYYFEKKDYNKTLEWYINASELGNTPAAVELGFMYYNGTGVKKDYLVALKWLKKAAESGDANAMFGYAYVLSQEEVADAVINYEYASALEEFQKAAEAGDADAMFNLGKMYEMGYGEIKKSTTKAFEWYQKAAEAGHVNAMYRMGKAYSYDGDLKWNEEKAVEWFAKAANNGHAEAMYLLAQAYATGFGIEENKALADEWFAKAAVGRANSSMVDDPLETYSDRGKVLNTAMEWYQKAADAGHATAMNQLGYYSSSGREAFYDSDKVDGHSIYAAKAEELYTKAAANGSGVAMYNLGMMYKNGLWGRQGDDVAMEWFIMSYSNGYNKAEKQIKEMLSKKRGVNAYFENYGELISIKP